MNILDIQFNDRSKNPRSLREFGGKYYLIINTASKCGLTPQFEGLEQINKTFKNDGLVTIGFPCSQFAGQEFATSSEANQFCKLNYGVTFEIMDKIDVNGRNESPLFKSLKDAISDEESREIKWNFTKFIVSGDGEVLKRFGPKDEPELVLQYLETIF